MDECKLRFLRLCHMLSPIIILQGSSINLVFDRSMLSLLPVVMSLFALILEWKPNRSSNLVNRPITLQKWSHGAQPRLIPIDIFPDLDTTRTILRWLCRRLRGIFAMLEVLISLSSASVLSLECPQIVYAMLGWLIGSSSSSRV